jgi:hypothetical protein
MSYIGSTPTTQSFIAGTDSFNGTGSATNFTLSRFVNSTNDIQVVVNNVVQYPPNYSVSGNTLTISPAPSAGTNNVYVRYLSTTLQSIAPSQGIAIQFGTGSASLPSISFIGDSNTGIYSPAADTIAFAEGGTEVARFDSSGNLGIGTTSPQQLLDVRGRIQVSNGTNGGQLGVNAGGLAISSIGAAPVSFYYNTFANETMRIDSSGNLLVGTTSQINSGALCVKQSGSLDCINTAPAVAGTYISARFCSSVGNTVGFISTSTSAVTYATSSDYRLKENIAPMTGALATVAALKPCTYKWKADGSDGQGFIAHELAEVVPDAVTGEKDGEAMQGVDYGKITPLLTAALQEAIAEIKLLKARVAELEEK